MWCSEVPLKSSTEHNPQIHPRNKFSLQQIITEEIYDVISGFHLFTFLAPVCVCLSLSLYMSFITVTSLLFNQSPCEYNPCRNGASCRPRYRSNEYFCVRSPGKIEQGRINFELQRMNPHRVCPNIRPRGSLQ